MKHCCDKAVSKSRDISIKCYRDRRLRPVIFENIYKELGYEQGTSRPVCLKSPCASVMSVASVFANALYLYLLKTSSRSNLNGSYSPAAIAATVLRVLSMSPSVQ